jgi:sigma-E factor negative regulatory protein RseB
MRMHEASRQRSYIGTFVVSSGNGAMSSARIWHACDGQRQVERVENADRRAALHLPARRRGAHLRARDRTVVRSEKRESLGMFPELLNPTRRHPEFYKRPPLGSDRVAGYDADIVLLVTPRTRCASATASGARRRAAWW